jgi:hypothetical protein
MLPFGEAFEERMGWRMLAVATYELKKKALPQKLS